MSLVRLPMERVISENTSVMRRLGRKTLSISIISQLHYDFNIYYCLMRVLNSSTYTVLQHAIPIHANYLFSES